MDTNISHIKHIVYEIETLSREIHETIIVLKIELAKCSNVDYDISNLIAIANKLDALLLKINEQIELNNIEELFRLLLVLKDGLYEDHIESLNLQIAAINMNNQEGQVISVISKNLNNIMQQIEKIVLQEEQSNSKTISSLDTTLPIAVVKVKK